ncbi:hypothetical protein AXG93_4273s1070 [Marchantia polymorpha subsp. ruderalis]|uniref:Plant heme peroxidase family profile domain-containing protein n=1 Tax=Marchantia polymorpha subsp. ruderalis TaxID=1480154 RepID=A0A176VG36_MARPO|nr:hypothetical protein AXG93_4273s1070 [Marchantia polymorpha subsp. ruderalis]
MPALQNPTIDYKMTTIVIHARVPSQCYFKLESACLCIIWQGCDASVLLNGPGTEKAAAVNKLLKSFEIIDKAKQELETVCPGVVSCSDILQYAARYSVVASCVLQEQTPGPSTA